VSRAVAVPAATRTGDIRLVAYCMLRAGWTWSDELADALRSLAAASLPPALVPADFAALAELPLTPSGTLDRKALAARGAQAQRPRAGAAQPRTPVETALCELFAQALGLPEVGVDEDFFELRGTSLAAVRLVGAISRRFGVDFKLRSLLQNPTVAALAEVVGAEIGQ
jgi:nonribosomal peptide synthetase DhbF